LAPQSQPIFAFQWENPNNGEKGQQTWIQLPQGFKNLPTIFGAALASDLKAFSADEHGCMLLQYVDELLHLHLVGLAGPTQEDYIEVKHLLLSLLWEAGYKTSRKKALICKTLSNTSAFTCPRGNAGSAPRGNRLYVPSQPLRPTSKLESFWELQVSAKSGSLTTPSCPNPSMKPQRGENGNL
jgi:hypothetical protein